LHGATSGKTKFAKHDHVITQTYLLPSPAAEIWRKTHFIMEMLISPHVKARKVLSYLDDDKDENLFS
jgi:hypothetical protein